MKTALAYTALALAYTALALAMLAAFAVPLAVIANPADGGLKAKGAERRAAIEEATNQLSKRTKTSKRLAASFGVSQKPSPLSCPTPPL
jgi:hypothetical protein